MELYYDKPWCKVSYIEEVACVYLKWHGFAQPEQFREACQVSLELLKEK